MPLNIGRGTGSALNPCSYQIQTPCGGQSQKIPTTLHYHGSSHASRKIPWPARSSRCLRSTHSDPLFRYFISNHTKRNGTSGIESRKSPSPVGKRPSKRENTPTEIWLFLIDSWSQSVSSGTMEYTDGVSQTPHPQSRAFREAQRDIEIPVFSRFVSVACLLACVDNTTPRMHVQGVLGHSGLIHLSTWSLATLHRPVPTDRQPSCRISRDWQPRPA